MLLEATQAYIQKNPLFGRKVIYFDRIRDSIWDWDLCDATVITIDNDPRIAQVKGVASSVYEHQGLEEISTIVFRKIENLVRLYEVASRVSDEQQSIVVRQETLGKIVELLTDSGIIDDTTYDTEHMNAYAEFYEHYSRQQMEHVTNVIDVHK